MDYMFRNAGYPTNCIAKDNSRASGAQGYADATANAGNYLDQEHLFAHHLKSCGNTKNLAEGKRVHAQILETGCHQSRYLCNLLVQMYGKCGRLEEAKEVFYGIQEPNAFTWKIMLTAYAQNGHLKEARIIFARMPERDVVCWTTMLAAYCQHGHLEEAKIMFEKIPNPDVVSWTTMLKAYAQNGDLQEARSLFERMPHPNNVSWTTMIQAYAENGHLVEARRMFEEMPDRDVVCWTALIKAYAENGDMQEARNMFEGMPQRNVVSYSTMVAGYAQNGQIEEARSMFERMPQRDVVSWTIMIKAYAQNGQLEEAKCLFDRMPEGDVVAWTAMVSAHAQCGHLLEARDLFDRMPERNIVSWNAMIKAYCENEQGRQAILMLLLMDLEGMQADEGSFISVLEACADVGALEQGKLIYSEIVSTTKFHTGSVMVGSAIVNMYGKCGELEEARRMFHKMPRQTVVSWNAMAAAYAHNGYHKDALNSLYMMVLEGVDPSEVTFITILSTCSQAGLLYEAWNYFRSMNGDYGLAASSEHYRCITDMLGPSWTTTRHERKSSARAGQACWLR